MVSVRNRSRERSRRVKRSRNKSRRVKRSRNKSRRVKRSRRIINSKRTKRIQKKTPRKQRTYMKLFKGGVLKYGPSEIHSRDTLFMDKMPYTFSKNSGSGKFGVKFFINDRGEQIIVKEIPKGRNAAAAAHKNIRDLGLIEGTHDFIVRVLDEGYVYEDGPSVSGDQVKSAYMYAMEPCSRDLLYNVTDGPVNITIIKGFLDAFNKLHGLGYVHGDIKAENALLCNGVVKVGDIDTIYPNETEAKWRKTSLFTPYHMLPQFTDKKDSTELPTGRPDLAEYPETYHLLKQDKLNTTVDRWAMGICVYEFYVGANCLRKRNINKKVLESMCWRIHNDLCHYYVMGKLPDMGVRSNCFAIMDRSTLNPSMKKAMLNTMTQYCLSDQVRGVLDNIKMERQPTQQQSLLKQKENLISEIEKEIKESDLRRAAVEYYIRSFNKDLNKLNDERSELNVKHEKATDEYNPLYEQYSDAYNGLLQRYTQESSESGGKPLLDELNSGIKQMKEKKEEIIYKWEEILGEIDSELTKKVSEIKKKESLIKDYRESLDNIIKESKQKKNELKKLKEELNKFKDLQKRRRDPYYGVDPMPSWGIN